MNLFITSILGGFFVSDATAVGQFMISRPIFCGPVIGLILGNMPAGLYAGMIMELLWVSVVPLGNAVPPDATIVAISVTYLSAITGKDYGVGYILFLLLCLVPAGILFKKIDMMHRNYNIKLSHKLDENINKGNISYVNKVIYIGTLFFIIKAAFFLFLVLLAGERFLPIVYNLLSTDIKYALVEAYYIVPAIGLGVLVTIFVFKKSHIKR